MTEPALLRDHVARFNAGVRRHDFTAMVEALAPDAELRFEGVPVGPFRGRAAIAAAYREQPPDDEIAVLDAVESDGEIVAGYAWRAEPERRAGELRLRHDDARITRLTVTFS